MTEEQKKEKEQGKPKNRRGAGRGTNRKKKRRRKIGDLKANKCPTCKALEENQRPVNAPKKTNDPCKKTAPIAIFKDEMEDFITGRYRKHLWLEQPLPYENRMVFGSDCALYRAKRE